MGAAIDNDNDDLSARNSPNLTSNRSDVLKPLEIRVTETGD